MRRFIFIGPDKSGSSWIYSYLRGHPECFVPVAKDIYFFDRYYDRGIDWYERYFEGAPASSKIVGELSHDYMFSRVVADRIREHYPDAILLSCLRDPVERTYSHYLYLVRSGIIDCSFEQALATRPELIENSLYWKHLRYYQDLFGDQLRLLDFRTLKRSEAAFAEELCRALEISDWHEYPGEVRKASRPRVKALAVAAKQTAHVLRKLGCANFLGYVKNSRINKLLYRELGDGERGTVDSTVRTRLVEVFRPDVVALKRSFQLVLEDWKYER